MSFSIPIFDFDRFIHGVKTVVACLLGFLVAKLLHLSSAQWVIVTIFVVMCAQSRVGALVQKSYMRFLGTLMGASISVVTLLFFADNPFAIMGALGFSALLFSYISEGPGILSDAGTIGAATVAIILIGQQPTVEIAIFRFLEIALGIMIAFLVSRFVWPLHSRQRLVFNIIYTLSCLKDFYNLLQKITPADDEFTHEVLDQKIITHMAMQRKLFNEVFRESFGSAALIANFRAILRCERELLRGISLMYHVLHNMSKAASAELNGHLIVCELHQQVNRAMDCIIKILQTKNVDSTPVLFTLRVDWKNQIQTVMQDVNNLLEEDVLHVDSFLFCAERLLRQLVELFNLSKTLVGLKV